MHVCCTTDTLRRQDTVDRGEPNSLQLIILPSLVPRCTDKNAQQRGIGELEWLWIVKRGALAEQQRGCLLEI